ncbi:hypothetical protein HIM_01308 [Hirsutella minnesotensis 3608]|uniref:Integrase catalytic domain-containing protein n=1 Tax=Hirsutella minnesotensis 3608 TaxID=1043627 RepID=A0A0F7ZMM8_9HYPO|nr:hypothetical protein HIM_08316 [Hirsutella minnesotensis 3608]KJZ79157.1 hypothetical protein HIM_01308 [Hirsutella minnesotensis 3608]
MSSTRGTSANAPTLDINEFLDVAEFNRGLATIFDMDLFNTPVNETSDEIHYNTYVLARIVDYKVSSTCQGLELLGSFQEDFEDWEEEDFKKVDPRVRKVLRNTLRFRGIYTGKLNAKITAFLVNLKNRDRLPEWDEDDLRDAILYEKTAAYRRQQELLRRSPSPTATPTATPAATPAPTPAPVTPDPNLPQDPSKDQALPSSQDNLPHQDQYLPRPSQQQELVIRPAINREAYRIVPPVQVPNEDLDPAIANQFSKLWDRKLNYSGDVYDILDDKIRYFLDACLTAGIKPSQFHALFSNILTKRAKNFFVHQVSRDSTFAEMYQKMKQHFDTEVNRQQYHTDWTSISFTQLRKESPEKPLGEILQALLDKLQLCQRALGNSYGGEDQLISTTIRACRGVPELEFALFVPAMTFEGLSSQLRSSLTTVSQRQPGQPSQYLQDQDQFFTDRRYQHPADKRKKWTKRCYVCGKEGCFSTKHPDDERKRAKERYLRERGFHGQKSSSRPFTTFLADYEGDPDEDQTSDSADDDSDDQSDSFFAAAFLSNRAFRHRIHTVEGESICEESQHFLLDRYNRTSFQGILPDTGAAKISTAGIDQFHALQREMPTVQLRKNATIATVRFGGNEPTNTIGITTVITPIGEVVFHVINMSTPFLLCLKDMDRLGAYLNNVTNELICGDKRIPIVRKWGHPWFFLRKDEAAIAFLSEAELRRLHTRFGHPSVHKLHKLLTSAGHDVEFEAIAMIRKFCHFCQIKADAPRRFKFTLKDNCDFNYELIVDVMHLDSRPVLHAVDLATSFQAGRFLQNISAKETWEALKLCWIDTYLGPPDVITHDAGTNFASSEFQAEAKLLGITCHQVPVEAHWSIGKVERYHAPIRRAYEILKAELKTASAESLLQMAFKSVNDTAGPDGLVPTLLVFGAYPRITVDSPPSASAITRAKAVTKAMAELRKLVAKRKVNDALNARNGPNTIEKMPLSLPLGSEVRVFREKGGWKGPYKVLAVTDTEVTVELDNGPAKFRSTAVQPYFRHPDSQQQRSHDVLQQPHADNQTADNQADSINVETEVPKPFEYPEPERPRRRGRPRKVPRDQQQYDTFVPSSYFLSLSPFSLPRSQFSPANMFLSHKERAALDLAVKLRAEKKITTAGRPFEASDDLEITNLLGAGVIVPERYPADAMTKLSPNGALSRFVNDNEITIRLEGWVQRKEDATA